MSTYISQVAGYVMGLGSYLGNWFANFLNVKYTTIQMQPVSMIIMAPAPVPVVIPAYNRYEPETKEQFYARQQRESAGQREQFKVRQSQIKTYYRPTEYAQLLKRRERTLSRSQRILSNPANYRERL